MLNYFICFFLTKNRRMKDVQALIRGIIDKRMKARQSGETNNDDLLGILLE